MSIGWPCLEPTSVTVIGIHSMTCMPVLFANQVDAVRGVLASYDAGWLRENGLFLLVGYLRCLGSQNASGLSGRFGVLRKISPNRRVLEEKCRSGIHVPSHLDIHVQVSEPPRLSLYS